MVPYFRSQVQQGPLAQTMKRRNVLALALLGIAPAWFSDVSQNEMEGAMESPKWLDIPVSSPLTPPEKRYPQKRHPFCSAGALELVPL